jgi:nucleotide-binding universal stress UspA family protein
MLPIRCILHPTNFSEHSSCAFSLAAGLARDYGARLVVLHVMGPPVATAPVAAYAEGLSAIDLDKMIAAARERLDRLPEPRPDVRSERRLAEGDAVEEILRVSQEIGADLIVLGTHGRTGLERLVMGSVAEQVVRKATCPVITVKTPLPEAVTTAVPAEETAPVREQLAGVAESA